MRVNSEGFMRDADQHADIAKYLKVAAYIRREASNGRWPDGRLPSQRDLARELGVGRNTVIRALNILARDGVITTMDRVRPNLIPAHADISRKLTAFTDRSGFEYTPFHRESIIRERSGLDVINLSAYGDERWDDYLNAEILCEALSDRVRKMKEGNFANLYEPGGQPQLRRLLSEYISTYAGFTVKPEQVIVISQWMQTFRLIAEVLLGPGVELWAPQISLVPIYGIGERQAAHRRYLPTDGHGLDITPMFSSKNPKVLFLEPDGQKPEGRVFSSHCRSEIADYAARTHTFVVEDCYAREWYADAAPPILSFDPKLQFVIHIGGSPISMNPFGGVTWIVANESLIEKFRACVRHELLSTSYAPQLIVTELLASGRYAEMVARSRAFHEEHLIKVQAVLNRELSGLASWECPSGFGGIWLDVCHDVSVRRLYNTRSGVDFQPGYLFGERGGNHIVLRYNLPLDRFSEGVSRLAALIRKLKKRR